MQFYLPKPCVKTWSQIDKYYSKKLSERLILPHSLQPKPSNKAKKQQNYFIGFSLPFCHILGWILFI